MGDHVGDCERAVAECDAYVSKNQQSLDDAKARIAAVVEQEHPGADVEDEVGRDLEQLLLEMVPHAKQIMEDFDRSCPGVADDIGQALKF
jgi:hypothetical protein